MVKYSYKRGKATFVNPYNFVRIDRTKEYKTSDSDNEEKIWLSGVLHCSFKTKTPLAIPDVELSVISERGHVSYPFYKINGIPAVPGSSIRGMLRNMYETLTDSCFVTLPDNESITARTSATNPFNPGILMKEGDSWVLYSAKRHNLYIGKNNGDFVVKTDVNGRYIEYKKMKYRMGEAVDIKVHKDKKTNKSIVDSISKTDADTKYFLYVGEGISNKKYGKKYESVFEKQNKVDLSSETIDRLLNGLINSIKIYQNKSINKKFKEGTHSGYKNFEYAKKNGVVCVWYKEVDGRYYLSMAAIGRKSYNETVNSMIGKHRNPCVARNDMCPACKLFGMAKGEGYGSRIRITDAFANGKVTSLGMNCLKELGSPRTGYYPFYTSNGNEYDQFGVVIAGRKYYWHIPNASKDSSVYISSEETERNATMELMDVGARFNFDLYYDNVSREQLDELKWILSLPDESGSIMHKLGHGKPLGLGSIKITINSDERRVFDGKNYIIKKQKVENLSFPLRFSENSWKQISILCNFNTMKDKEVRYPYIDIEELKDDVKSKKNDFAAHQWFTSNKGRKKNDPKPMTLVNVNDKDRLNLKVYVPIIYNDGIRKEKNNFERRNGRKY